MQLEQAPVCQQKVPGAAAQELGRRMIGPAGCLAGAVADRFGALPLCSNEDGYVGLKTSLATVTQIAETYGPTDSMIKLGSLYCANLSHAACRANEQTQWSLKPQLRVPRPSGLQLS